MQVANWTITDIDRDTYSDFLANSTGVTVFHSLEWLRVIQDGFGVGVKLVGIWKGGELCAVCPLEYQGPRLFTIFGSPLPRLFTPYQGLVWKAGTEPEERLASIRELIGSLRAPYLRMQWQPENADDIVFGSFEKAYTPTLDLTVGEERLFKGMKGETRNQVRQAFRRGVDVKFVQDGGDWVDEYVKLSISTYERQGLRSPMRKAFLTALFNTGKKVKQGDSIKGEFPAWSSGLGARAVLASVAGYIVAASLLVFDHDTVYYLDNVSLREYQHFRANNAIVWESIRWACNNGFTRYDLVGANIPSIAAFKFGFGAIRESFPVVTSFSGIGRLAYSLSRFARRLRKASRHT